MILHIPHASTNTAGLNVLAETVLNTTDHFTDELFNFPANYVALSEYNRNVVDLERLVNDPLEKVGQGILYANDYRGNSIKRNGEFDKDLLVYYSNHHKQILLNVQDDLAFLDKCVLVDCHSFSNEQAGLQTAPDICIGVNDDQTFDKVLTDKIVTMFCSMGYSVEVNHPYSNSLSIATYKDGFISVMIEINKKLYMDIIDGVATKNQNFTKVKNDISKVLTMIDNYETGSITVS